MQGFDGVRREIIAQRSHGTKLLAAISAIAVPAVLRWVVDGGAGGAAFVTFWPAVLLTAAFFGWQYGALTAIGSAAVAIMIFIPAELGRGGSTNLWVIVPFFASGIAVTVFVGHLLRSALIEVDARARQSHAFNLELQHRAKNSLQMMRALASRASQATDPAEFYATLASRLDALAQANELLVFGAVESCDLGELVSVSLRPFPGSQITCSGPKCLVAKDAVTPLTMAMHELGTNASKYGALSCPEGRVEVTWQRADDGAIVIGWNETGGPEVRQPSRRGIGSRLLQAYGGIKALKLEYEPAGLRCRVEVREAAST